VTLTKLPPDDFLDLPVYRGQRTERFVFAWVNGVTGEILGELHPERGSPPQLSHDSTGTTKRRLTFTLGADETAAIDPITDRVLPSMVVGGVTWPLGRYMFTDQDLVTSTGGERGNYTLLDEMFAVDQQLETSYTSTDNVRLAILALLSGARGMAPVPPVVEATPYLASGSAAVGQTRGQALDSYATQGDYFSPWFAHDQALHMIRTFDPADEIPDFDFDSGGKVVRDTVHRRSDVLTAPNRFVVTSTAADAAAAGAMVGTYDVPSSAPFSEQRRGFRIVDVTQAQLVTLAQVIAAARNRGLRATVYDRVTVTTALDPRHDAYNVIRFLGDNWLELGWTMECRPGGAMQHTMRKAYR
jgi:hypothetical protein